MLELLFKGLLQWLFDMLIHITEYLANSLLTIFSMDLAYFETAVPVTGDIFNIITCLGWALLLGNLTFQAAKSMMSGLGFEGESPQTLFARTFVMTFLLVFSRQVCDVGLGIAKGVIELLQVPEIVQVPKLSEDIFQVPGDASWLLVIIVGFILIVQLVKLFFEIGERYVVLATLSILSPLAFAMGGSKSTADIFRGWTRMFGSMCLMVVLSVVFLKFLLSAMSVVPSGVEVIPWTIFVVAIAKTGRKIDALIMRIGLNPAATGDPLGGFSRMPGMLTYAVARSMAQNIGQVAASSTHNGNRRFFGFGGAGANPVPPAGPTPVSGGGTTVRSSVEYATAGQNHDVMQTNTRAASGGISHGQKATRPQMEKVERSTARNVSQNGGNTAFSHSDASVSAETTQSSRTMASTEPKRAATPSASRPTAQTRTAQTAGRNGGISRYSVEGSTMGGNAAGVKPFNMENKPPGAGKAGSFHTDKNIAADGLPMHSNLADVRGSLGAGKNADSSGGKATHHASHTTHTSHTAQSSHISVQQGETDRQTRPQGADSEIVHPKMTENGRMPRPSVGGVSRQNGAAQDGKKPGRPDRAAQDKQSRNSRHTESVSAHRSAKVTEETTHSQTHRQTTQSQMHGQTTTPTERARPASTSAMPQSVRPQAESKSERTRPSFSTSASQSVRPQTVKNESAKDTSVERARPPLSVYASQNTHSRSADGGERAVLRGAAVQKAVRNGAAESRPQADRLDGGKIVLDRGKIAPDKGKPVPDRGKNGRRQNPAQTRNSRATKENGNGYDPRE